jgi:uncharacterized protein (TIGR03437 family)
VKLRLPIGLLLAALSSQAAYHYVHYASRNSFTPIFEKFNLSALPNKTVTVQVSDQGPAVYAPNDSFGSVLAQIKAAAAAWNSVSASDLRVAFGGLEQYTANPTVANPGGSLLPGNTPDIDVVFVDTLGLLGLGAPTSSTVQAVDANGPYFPIVRGVVMLTHDTSNPNGPGPSYTEEFFTTAVHEIGHAIGLQHTWTSSAMSQDVIRNTSRARAVDADDIASVATLYGQAHLTTSYGSISGRVTFANGTGVALASVVAISPTGPAVSTLTNPDGSYQIVGLPPNYSYLVYAHPLPPDAVPTDRSGLVLPVDPAFQPFNPSGSFVTVFNAGPGVTLDPNAATSYPISAGSTLFNVNFTVQPRTGVPAYDVETYSQISSGARQYSYSGDAQVVGYPAFIDVTKPGLADVIVRAAPGVPDMPTPNSMTILGGFAPALRNNSSAPSVVPYSGLAAVVEYFVLPDNPGAGPRHLVFNFGNDIYVLPYAVDLVQKGPPRLAAVAPNGDGTVTVSGAGLGPDTRIFFDGMQASSLGFSGGDAQGSVVVVPPQGASGQVATVTAFNSDGQNSLILATAVYAVPSAAASAVPPTYTYPTAAPQLLTVSPAALGAGSSAAVDITALGTNFVDGQVAVGLGSDDISVRRVWVLSPTHLIADVVVAPNAALGLSEVSVASGMQVLSQPNAFQTLTPVAGAPLIALPIVNALTGLEQIYAGGFASIYGQNLAAFGTQLTLNGQPVPVLSSSATQINFQVPANVPAGPATLRLAGPTSSAPPLVIQIDSPAPVINPASLPAPGAIFSPGDTLTLAAAGLDPSLAAGYQGRVRVTVSGIDMAVTQVAPAGAGTFQIQAVLTQSFGSSPVPLTLVVDGSPSAPATVVVR